MEVTPTNNDGFYTYARSNINERQSEFDTDLFMELLTAQLTHQDPFEPMSNGELFDNISRMADVDTMDKMHSELIGMNANMDAMNAASMVGKQVVASKLDTGDIVSGKVTKVGKEGDNFVLTIKDDISGLDVKASMGSIREVH